MTTISEQKSVSVRHLRLLADRLEKGEVVALSVVSFGRDVAEQDFHEQKHFWVESQVYSLAIIAGIEMQKLDVIGRWKIANPSADMKLGPKG